jgi:cytochrome P450
MASDAPDHCRGHDRRPDAAGQGGCPHFALSGAAAPDFWPDPDRFDPERFVPASTERRNPLPTALRTRPRACIGENLALVEMHTHVATLARRFELELVPGQKIEREPQVNLRMRHPLRMIPRVRQRTNRQS